MTKEQILEALFDSVKHIAESLDMRFTEVMADMLKRYGDENDLQEKEFD